MKKIKIGSNIKKFRELTNLSQEELAKRIGITRNFLSLIENNHKRPSMKTLEKISEVLDVPKPLLALELDTSKKNNSIDKLLFEAYEIAQKRRKKTK
jgi:transcriptional regulator with XRE-family HTH domain